MYLNWSGRGGKEKLRWLGEHLRELGDILCKKEVESKEMTSEFASE